MSIAQGILNVDRIQRGEVVWLPCCWDDCEENGVDLHRALFHDHARGYACESPYSRHLWYVFCSERHRQLFLGSHIQYGRLPVGERGRLI